MKRNENVIDLSVIIPIFNVEDFLTKCIDSLIMQHNLRLEILLVNDGSTDRSGEIAEKYALQDNRIKVIHQKNGGASAARNAGLAIAQGKYIAFFDSDDWVKEDSLIELVQFASELQTDVLVGRIWYCRQDGRLEYTSKCVHDELLNITLSGKACFNLLIKTGSYLPMTFLYIYRKQYLDNIQARFEEGIMHEDELWTPPVLYQAEKAVIIKHEFYFYRNNNQSVSNITGINRRLYSLQKVTNKLFEFADRLSFSGEDREFKSWLYVNIYRIFSFAFTVYISQIRDSSILLPEFQIERFHRDKHELMSDPYNRCDFYYQNAEKRFKQYNEWRASEWVAPVASQLKSAKKKMLIYNTEWGKCLTIKIKDVPDDWIITTDRRYLKQADAVVFHLPDLFREMEFDIEKKQGQIWIAWHLEPKKNYPWFRDPEIADVFDLWMSHHRNTDVLHPCYIFMDNDMLFKNQDVRNIQNKCCLFDSEDMYFGSRKRYLKKLMKHTKNTINSNFENYMRPLIDNENRKEFFRNHKFVISFENAIEKDYVTGKFFEPLIAGSVPVYLGAHNIYDYAPGDNCFVDVRKYDSPQSLALFINSCYENEQLYSQFFEWKKRPLRSSFLQKVEMQKEHPFVRLCRKVNEKLSSI